MEGVDVFDMKPLDASRKGMGRLLLCSGYPMDADASI
jgi:hypothetical protein